MLEVHTTVTSQHGSWWLGPDPPNLLRNLERAWVRDDVFHQLEAALAMEVGAYPPQARAHCPLARHSHVTPNDMVPVGMALELLGPRD